MAALGPVYEHSPHFARRAAGKRPFADVDHLRHALQQEVNHAPEEEKIALIEAHPDLVGRAVLTAGSQGEQAAAGRFVTFARLLVCVAGATL